MNDNRPVFNNSQYVFHIDNVLTYDVMIGPVSAYDLDTGNNSILIYSIVSPIDFIQIDPSSGFLKLNKSITNLKESVIQILIEATDLGEPSLNGLTTVTLLFNSPNLYPPVVSFDASQYYLLESIPIGTPFATFYVTDQNNMCCEEYILEPADSPFEISTKTNQILTKEKLNVKLQDSYTLALTVFDNKSIPSGQRNSTQSVVIIVVDVNDCAPVLTPFVSRLDVVENYSLNKTIFQFGYYDCDEGPNAELQSILIYPQNTPFAFVFINNTINFQLVRSLDFEQTNFYSIQVKLSDNGNISLSSIQNLSIYIQDVNDNPPIFVESNAYRTLQISTPLNLLIYTANAFDPDSVDNGN